MNKRKIENIILCVLVLAAVVVVVLLLPTLNSEKSINSTEYTEVYETVSTVIAEQPAGFGVERPISTDLATPSDALPNVGGVGSIDFSGAEVKTITDIKGAFSESEKKLIADKLEKDTTGKYKCNINWYKNKSISNDEYKALIVATGKMLEDTLNKSGGNYSVIANVPNIDDLNTINVPIMWDIDIDGYLTIWSDVITQDLNAGTEVEEIKAFTLYYDEEYLTFK